MTTTVPQPSYTWRVTSTVGDTDVGVGGTVVSGQRLYFAVDDPAVSGSVFVPDSRKGDLGYVRSLIGAEAAQLAALVTLTSG